MTSSRASSSLTSGGSPPSPQCQDLPGSQSSSPLSQMDSYSGRSMDPLLPTSEPLRKKVPDVDYDGAQRYQSERHRSHVGS